MKISDVLLISAANPNLTKVYIMKLILLGVFLMASILTSMVLAGDAKLQQDESKLFCEGYIGQEKRPDIRCGLDNISSLGIAVFDIFISEDSSGESCVKIEIFSRCR